MHKLIATVLLLAVELSQGFQNAKVAYSRSTAAQELSCFSNGECVTVFEDDSAGASKRSIQVGRSSNLGTSWATEIELENSTARGRDVSLSCIESQGAKACVVVWARSDSIMLSKSIDGGSSWSTPSSVSIEGTRASTLPAISCFVDPQSTRPADEFECFLIVKREGTGAFLSAVKLTDGASTVASTESIPKFALDPWGHKVSCQADGSFCVVTYIGCTSANDCYMYSSRTTDGGVTWSSPLQIETSSLSNTERTNNGILVAIYDLALACAPGTQVCILVTDPYSFPAGTNNVNKEWIEVARSQDGGASWSKMEVSQTVSNGWLSRPSISCTGTSYCVMGWELYFSTAQKRQPFYRLSSTLGATWTLPQQIQGLSDNTNFESIAISCSSAADACLSVFKRSSSLMSASLINLSSVTSSPVTMPTGAPTGTEPSLQTLSPTVSPTNPGETRTPTSSPSSLRTEAPTKSGSGQTSGDSNANGSEETGEGGDSVNGPILWMGIIASASGMLLLSGLAIRLYRSKDFGGMTPTPIFPPSNVSKGSITSHQKSVFSSETSTPTPSENV